MKKISYLFALLLVASIIFTSCRDDNDDESDNPIGIGSPTPITDPGVLIGAINGVPIRWATRNVNVPGTFATRPEDAGRLFQWGTLSGETHHFDNTTPGTIDGWNRFSRNRVAWIHDPCPRGWRLPTFEEFVALLQAGYSEWTQRNGVYGVYFGVGRNRIFMPAAGSRGHQDGNLLSVTRAGVYWSSTERDSLFPHPVWGNEQAETLSFFSGRSGILSEHFSSGFSIRCVAE